MASTKAHNMIADIYWKIIHCDVFFVYLTPL